MQYPVDRVLADLLYYPQKFQKTLNIITDNPRNEKERKMKKREEIEAGLVHAETVIQTVMTLGSGSTIIKELADEAATAFDALPAIRAAATGADQNRPKKIADRFKTAKEATAAHEKERVLMVVVWAQLKWLYMEDIEGESRLDYLKRCRTEGILKSDGYKELKRLEKAAKEGGAK